MELQKTNIEFRVNNKLIKFNIIHNLSVQPGANIRGALDNWLARTNKYTAKSFCNYINSKGVHTAMTESQCNRILKMGT